ncbi:HD domain-containing phosphohydrolase [Verrucomicrobium sp. GAS474]|uniref:HD domain-containing phosphohydrolase n=1 Tax=Verrucomicrobium sp. GAS474 TaxID=1882831 RepID=UPI001390122B|nr:HD domain-containing phosphohydrolase [Verrucomicrobium sp. GAS474]
MSEKVLFVDDDPNTLVVYQRFLQRKFEVEVAGGAEEALALIGKGASYAVIVADMEMPGMSGTEFLEKTRLSSPDTVRMMLTGSIDPQTAIEAINKGSVYRFLSKPCPADVFALAIEEALKQYRLVTAERELLEQTLAGSIKVLVDMLALVEPAAFVVGERVRDYLRDFGTARRSPDAWTFEVAALLSQIRFIALPSEVTEKVRKGKPLDVNESEMMARATGASHDLIRNIPRLQLVAEIVLSQQKNYDGSGYPQDGASETAIPYGARLLKIFSEIVDWENRGGSLREALAHMEGNPGQFDPALVVEVLERFRIDPSDTPTGAKEIREVALADLAIGQILMASIMTSAGLVVLAGGSKITRLLLERVRNFAAIQRLVEPFRIEVKRPPMPTP